MVRYFLKFSYIGTQYRGLQRQSGEGFIRDTDSIQGALETALLTIIPKVLVRPAICLSSRTDAGVHALCNTCHVELENKYGSLYNASSVKKYVNRYFAKCGHNIRLLDCIPVTHDFHVRKAAKSRTYIYRFMIPKVCEEQRISLVESIHSYHIRAYNLNIDRMRHGIKLFMGTKDFTTFSAKKETSHKIKFIRSLNSFTLEEAQPLMPFDPLSENFTYWHFICSGKSFLYNQIRRMVGALFALGLGKITEKDITVMLQVPGHHNWNPRATPAPPNGLHLLNVEYDLEELKRCTILEEQNNKNKLQSEEDEEQELRLEEQKQKLQLKE